MSLVTRSLLVAVAATSAILTLPIARAAESAESPAAAAYCASSGGESARMLPWANTNAAPNLWQAYGGPAGVCTFTANDGSRITVFNQTLASPLPTMAALAYYAKTPWDGKGFGNPAWLYCTQLGGTQQIGAMGAGSGWAAQAGDAVSSLCVFADRSAIDDWGLFYHSEDIVRGADLDGLLRFPNPYR